MKVTTELKIKNINIEEQNYLDLGKKIIEQGRYKQNRTGVNTYSLFGAQLRFDLQKGFPLLTTSKTIFKPMIAELLWFLEGSTNNERLHELGAKFWDKWALKEDVYMEGNFNLIKALHQYADKYTITFKDAFSKIQKEIGIENDFISLSKDEISKLISFLEKEEITVDKKFKVGDLGPIYGKQWRDFNGVDQISNLIKDLKEKPFSRRHIVSAWNPNDLADDGISPEENILNGKMSLSPCHCLFQFNVEEATPEERSIFLKNKLNITLNDHVIQNIFLEEHNVPKLKLNCQLYQRSCDYPVGGPVNIASYSLLTMMIAQVVDMIPGDFVHTFGDVHVYEDQVELFKEQLKRNPYSFPFIKINPNIKDIFDFKLEDFELVNYNHHTKIVYPVAK